MFPQGVVAGYVHGAIAPNLGKIGVLVALESDGDQDKLQALGKQNCHACGGGVSTVSDR